MECVIFMAFLGRENSGKEKDNFVDVVIYICYYNNGKEDIFKAHRQLFKAPLGASKEGFPRVRYKAVITAFYTLSECRGSLWIPI